MFFHPDDNLSREELLEKIWATRLSPGQRAYCLKAAEVRGLTYTDLLNEVVAQYDVVMADPVQRDEWLTIHEEMLKREDLPFGPDPLLEQDGAA